MENAFNKKTILPLIIFFIDLVGFLLGSSAGFFDILKKSGDEYYISNNELGLFVLSTMIGVLSLYQVLHNMETDMQIAEHIGRVEAHLINYSEHSLEYKYLSSIENDIGVHKCEIVNEIWIITNNLEEKNDTDDGNKCRDAIISNLKSNVNYYYIVSGTKKEDMSMLCDKIKKELELKCETCSGEFNYYYDDALDFVPVDYFDIVLYLKRTDDGKYVEKPDSVMCYCFSKKAENHYYTMVDDKEIRERLFGYISNYKKYHTLFKNSLVLPRDK